MRQMAVWIPDWPITAAEMAGVAPVGEPAAVLGGRGIVVANAWARSLGISAGMKKRHAQSLCPELTVIPVDTARDTRMFEPVLRALDRLVARLTIREPGNVIFPVCGAARANGGEEALADAVGGEVATIAGCEARVGVAEGTLAALLAARSERLVPAASTRAFLASQPVSTLLLGATSPAARADMSHVVDLLDRLGVRTLGAVHALGRSALITRFGMDGVTAWNLASGQDITEVLGKRSIPVINVTRAFEPPLDVAEQAAFAARAMSEELTQAMAVRGVGGGELAITATTEAGEFTRSWMIDGGQQKDLTDRVRWQLAAWINSGESGGALSRLTLCLSHTVALGSRPETLWGGRGEHAVAAARGAERIQSILGEDAVRAPRDKGGRTPQERYREETWGTPETPAPHLPWPGHIPDPAPVVIPTGEVSVALTGACGHALGVSGNGQLVCTAGCATAVPTALISGRRATRITNFAGPWVMEQRWWDPHTAQRRAYLQVVLSEGAALLYTEHGTWREAGSYV